ncbi:hypothetical protein NUW58_g1218 [Xylaria curta]|uniref:Uncharacterized protein n=1 Tax=Xylaria curta TaxID=42375 RepID=A0ACC1PMT6_9PEZI|nr:hypothetical protein NUW58_g1218 [Xylaria curta]
MSSRSKATITAVRQAQKKDVVQDLLDRAVDCRGDITALVRVSSSGVTVQPAPGAFVSANTDSQAEKKADSPKGVRIDGTISRALTVGGNVKTQKSVVVKAETPEAARERAKLENKEQPKRAPQPSPGAVGVFIGGNATQAIVVGEDLEATEGITIE